MTQTDMSNDKAMEGLPEAEDYDPDALGTIDFRAGEPEQEWPEYGLEMVPVEYKSKTQDNWVDTGRRQIVRNGKYIADVSEDYRLLPNEQLVKVANNVARDLGAVPFHEFDGDWFARLDDHVFQDKERRRIHALYSFREDDVGGDNMNYGFAVHNSIDSSLGLSVGLFTFRHACANMVFIGTSGSLEQFALNVESEREVLNLTKRHHTSGLEVNEEALEATILGTIGFIDDVHESYQEWINQQLEPEHVRHLFQLPQLAISDLPEWMQETEDFLSDIAEDRAEAEEEFTVEEQDAILEAEIPAQTSVWETYNGITQSIWHRGESQDTTRQGKMRDVHKVFEPAPEADVTLR